MKKSFIKCLALLSLLCLCQAAFAAITPPQQTVISVSRALRNELKSQQPAIKADPKKTLYNIVKRIVLPYVDVNAMVKVVLGRAGHNDWQTASAAKRQAFIDQFIILIVGTYSAALQEYDNQPVRVYPVRGYRPGQRSAEVHSVMLRDNGQKITLLYNLLKEGDDWKITDFSVEGISLIQSYQAQFQSIVQSDGLNGLINVLKKHNAKTSNN